MCINNSRSEDWTEGFEENIWTNKQRKGVRTRRNMEVKELYNEADTVDIIGSQTLASLEHSCRMKEEWIAEMFRKETRN